MDPLYALAGAFVGLLVGLTGVGGGSLMAPILILAFGFNPSVAIGTDLWFAAITKTAGGIVHHKFGSPDWRLVGLLAIGSIPAAALTLLWLQFAEGGRLDSAILMRILGCALLVTAVLLSFRTRLTASLLRLKSFFGLAVRRHQTTVTVLGGAGVGVLVTLTSVGAGAMVALILAVVYPLRLTARSIVGTDVIHAVPLTLTAAIGHSWLGNTDLSLLAGLLVGSIPGVIAGSFLSGTINERVIRYALSVMLVVSGGKLLFV